MKKEVNLLPIIGIVLLAVLILVLALTLTQCGGAEPQPTEPSAVTDPTEDETQPTETEEPTEPPHVHEYEATVTEPDCISSGYTTYVCACGESYVGDETEALGHSWADATCTAPKTCTVCAVTEGRAKDHSWDKGKVTKEETETEDGEMLFTCTACGATKTQVIPSPGHTHNYEENVVVTLPTCTEDGYTTHTCRCGDSKVDSEVDPLGHSWKDATCTAPEVCTVCGTTGDPAPGHKWQDATCTEPMTCKVCGATTGVPKGHTEVTVNGYAPTCTKTGLTDGKKCFVCGEILLAQKVIPAKGHTETTVKGKGPTCTETGLTDGIQCSVSSCKAWIKEQEVIPALGHKEEAVGGYDSTCTETGLTDGKKCTVCGEWTLKQEIIKKKDHTEVAVKGYAATCTEEGLTDGVQCSVCKTWIDPQETIDVVPHTEVTVKGYDSTCTKTGLTDGKKCSVCGTVTVAQKTIDKVEHTPVVVAGYDSTCTKTGLTDGKKCSVCGVILLAQETIAKKTHTEVVVEGYEPTCTLTGLTDGKKCSVCQTITLAHEVIPALGHSYGDWQTTKQVTCGADGTQRRNCIRCTKYETQTIPATGNHTYEWGLCNVCGHDTLLKYKEYTFNTFNVNNTIDGANGYYITLSDTFDMTALKNRGFTMHVSMRFTLTDVDAGSDDEYEYGFRIYNNDTDVRYQLYDSGISDISEGSHGKTYENIVNVSVNSLSTDYLGFLFVEDTYSLFGVKTNEYQVSGLVMTVYFTQ